MDTAFQASSGGSPERQTTVIALNEETSRSLSLDIIRGIAVLGILITAVWEFGGFSANKQIFFKTGTHGGNYTLFSWISILFEGKMASLFALVFGAALIIYALRTDKSPTLSRPDLYIRKQLWLMILGIFAAVCLLYAGDILFAFAVLGVLLFAFCRMSTKALLIASVVVALIYCGKIYWNYADDNKAYKKYTTVKAIQKKFVTSDTNTKKKIDSLLAVRKKNPFSTQLADDTLLKRYKTDTLTKRQASDTQAWSGILKRLKYDSSGDNAANKAMRSPSYKKIWDYVLPKAQERESYWLYRTGIWDFGSMMLLGMALVGFGFFSQRFSSRKYFLIAVVTLVAGLALAWFRVKYDVTRTVDYEKFINHYKIPYNLFFPVEKYLMVIGYASLAMWLLRMRALTWLCKIFETVGRMAFSNYFLMVIGCTFFFYGYGMSYFGWLNQRQLYLAVFELWLLQILFSFIWLNYFAIGPVEWLWRCLIYRKWTPIEKNPRAVVIAETRSIN